MPAAVASLRWSVVIAPGGLAVVQDLVNTQGGGEADLLASLDVARHWVSEVAPAALPLDAHDVAELRVLRDDLRAALADGGPRRDLASAADVALTSSGRVTATPQGSGARWLRSAALVALFTAELTGTRPRLKLCRNERCGVAFYDRSRNRSAVWHDARTCGNVANLRASRARRRGDDAM